MPAATCSSASSGAGTWPRRFLREIKLAARLQHPHILSVHDSGETAGQAEAERLLRDLENRSSRSYVSATNVAVLLAGLGDTTGAFQRLSRAADEKDPFLIYHFVNDPILEGLRRDPRGVALLKRMNLRVSN